MVHHDAAKCAQNGLNIMIGTYVLLSSTRAGNHLIRMTRVWTAVERKVHSPTFIYNALKNGRQGDENAHDVYCSGCGTISPMRADGDLEGPASNIWLAGVSFVQVP